MGKNTFGDGTQCYVMAPAVVADTAAHSCIVTALEKLDYFGAILLAGGGAGTLDGAWKVEFSDDYSGPAAGSSADGQPPNASTATWVDVTASAIWVDAIAAVAHASAATTKQYVQPKYPVGARAVRFTFTGTTGSAIVSVIFYAKSLSGS